jgi:site-specific DNA recombinase
MVEVFDAPWGVLRRCHPAIQTTTSMGRLTLNVLLAFAQFEREVTAERIRDKIAASKCSGRYFEEYVEVGGEWKYKLLRFTPYLSLPLTKVGRKRNSFSR